MQRRTTACGRSQQLSIVHFQLSVVSPVEADIDADAINSNTFEMEWPPRSGKTARFSEVDRAAWFDPATAKQKINPAQAALINELLTRI